MEKLKTQTLNGEMIIPNIWTGIKYFFSLRYFWPVYICWAIVFLQGLGYVSHVILLIWGKPYLDYPKIPFFFIVFLVLGILIFMILREKNKFLTLCFLLHVF